MAHQCLWTEPPCSRLSTRQVVHDFRSATFTATADHRPHHRLFVAMHAPQELSGLDFEKAHKARTCTTAPKTRAL